jgi:hypothetical protein
VKSCDVINFSGLFVGRYASDDKLYKRWPLDSQYESRITRNFRELTNLIEADTVFVNSLNSAACINSLQKCDIDETSVYYDKVRKLLDFLLQSSFANYEDFVECLKKTNQHLVAKIVEDEVGELIAQVNTEQVLENKPLFMQLD